LKETDERDEKFCESSGYVVNALVYCGKSDAMSGFGHSEAIVLKHMEKYMDVGHKLFVDNFYTSVPLVQRPCWHGRCCCVELFIEEENTYLILLYPQS